MRGRDRNGQIGAFGLNFKQVHHFPIEDLGQESGVRSLSGPRNLSAVCAPGTGTLELGTREQLKFQAGHQEHSLLQFKLPGFCRKPEKYIMVAFSISRKPLSAHYVYPSQALFPTLNLDG
jgi:hypothetical protein